MCHCLCATVVVDAFPRDVNHDRLHRCFVPVADLLSGGRREYLAHLCDDRMSHGRRSRGLVAVRASPTTDRL